MMDVGQCCEKLDIPDILTALLREFSAVTDYRTLRDSLPQRLASLLNCRCVLLYLRIGETLQLASGSFDDKPGWSAALLAVAHINPISLSSDLPEARAWRERRTIGLPTAQPSFVAIPLIYRQHCIGVLITIRDNNDEELQSGEHWQPDELKILEAVAGIVALLLENTRLLEHDRERIHELSLLNSISSQINYSMYEMGRMRGIVIQRTKEISGADLCELVESSSSIEQITWVTPALCERLFQRFQELRSLAPLIFERSGADNDIYDTGYLDQVPDTIKTFFALPLLSGRAPGKPGNSAVQTSLSRTIEERQESKVLGIIIGGHYRAWKLRQTELTLLQVLANQTSAALDNMRLMNEVVEARNEARKLLRQVLDNQRLKELILESIPSGLITTDLHGRVQTFNHAAEKILGYSPYEVLGQSLHRFLDLRSDFSALPYAKPPTDPNQPPELLYTSTYTGEMQRGTVVTGDRYAHELVMDVDISPLCNDLGERIGMLVTFTDMTSMHRLEEEKRRLDRLASLGEMAAGVAHEVRNPLASIKTSIQMLQDDLQQVNGTASEPSDSPTDWAQQSISVVLKEVERLDTIVRDLLLFAKNNHLHRTRCHFKELCEHVRLLIQPQCLEAGIEVHTVYAELPSLWVDMGQIEQVMLNICINALQAMSDGGILTISCRSISAEHAVHQSIDAQELAYQHSSGGSWLLYNLARQKDSSIQQWLECVISDTGIGLAPDQLKHIFQPFYTTKAHGIGLGLAISRRLIEDHGGYMLVESHLGYGATMVIRLPLITDTLIRQIQHDHEEID